MMKSGVMETCTCDVMILICFIFILMPFIIMSMLDPRMSGSSVVMILYCDFMVSITLNGI